MSSQYHFPADLSMKNNHWIEHDGLEAVARMNIFPAGD